MVIGDIPANANGESAFRPISPLDDGHLAAKIATRTIKDFMRVAVLGGVEAFMGVRMRGRAVVRVRHDCGDELVKSWRREVRERIEVEIKVEQVGEGKESSR